GAWRHPWQLLLSAVLVVFVALSIAASESFLAAVVVLCILAMVAIFRFVFAVYGCLFLFFVESSFAQARIESMSLAFVLPLLGFVAGSFRHRAIIADV